MRKGRIMRSFGLRTSKNLLDRRVRFVQIGGRFMR